MSKEVNEKTKNHVKGFLFEFSELLEKYKVTMEIEETSSGYYSFSSTIVVDFESDYDNDIEVVESIDLGTFIDKDVNKEDFDITGY